MLSRADWMTLVIAITGLLTTATAPLLQSWLSARNEGRAWRRDARAAVYADALTYVQVTQQHAEDLTIDPWQVRSWSRPEIPHRDLITARMRLLADSAAFDKWQAFLDSDDAFASYVTENHPEAGTENANLVPFDEPYFVKLMASAEEVSAAIRDSLDR
jgi:hypothetical protein